jgi:hypothetical protein
VHRALREALAGILLNGKSAAALIGIAEQTLRQARCNSPASARHDLYLPTPVRVPPATGTRARVYYPLVEVIEWAEWQRRPLHWHALPVSYALPAAQAHRGAGVALPALLAARAGGS